ncbi:hypothetical protein L1887_06093 [Cichorium endivia]|nr:hypothetical protein L1887_06093 [Cichorium endivia]
MFKLFPSQSASVFSKTKSQVSIDSRYTVNSKINPVMEYYDVIDNESDDSGTNSSWNSDTDCEIDEIGVNHTKEDELDLENEYEEEEIGVDGDESKQESYESSILDSPGGKTKLWKAIVQIEFMPKGSGRKKRSGRKNT